MIMIILEIKYLSNLKFNLIFIFNNKWTLCQSELILPNHKAIKNRRERDLLWLSTPRKILTLIEEHPVKKELLEVQGELLRI